MADVFISHSSKDKYIADKLCDYLERRGLTCWIAPRDITPGSEWPEAISNAIIEIKAMVIIYSQNSATSTQVPKEITLASKRDKLILPYKIDDTELEGSFDYFLSSAHWITADLEKGDTRFEELYHVIRDSISIDEDLLFYLDEDEIEEEKVHVVSPKVPKKKNKKKWLVPLVAGLSALGVATMALIIIACVLLFGLLGKSDFEYLVTDNGLSVVGYTGTKTVVEIPDKIKGDPVKAIGKNAFMNNQKIKTVIIPNSVTVIDENAFANSSVEKVVLPQGLVSVEDGAFYNCVNLKNIIIPDNTVYIGAWAFAYSGIKDIKIPSYISEIYDATFLGCTELTKIELPSGLLYIGPYAFSETGLREITIPEQTILIDYSAFNNCQELTTVVLPDNLQYIPEKAFYQCAKLTDVDLPSQLKIIEYSAFAQTGLQRMDFSQYPLIHIGVSAFEDCSQLEDVILPEDLIKIDDYAFKNCINLSEIIIPDNIKALGNEIILPEQDSILVYQDTRYQSSDIVMLANTLRESLASDFFYRNDNNAIYIERYKGDSSVVVVPDSINGVPVKVLGAFAFDNNQNMEYVILPSGLETIANEAFYGTSNLKMVAGGEFVSKIGVAAFIMSGIVKPYFPINLDSLEMCVYAGCDELTYVNVPVGVTAIGEGSFSFCANLTTVTFSQDITQIHKTAFDDSKNVTVICGGKHYDYDEIPEIPILVNEIVIEE